MEKLDTSTLQEEKQQLERQLSWDVAAIEGTMYYPGESLSSSLTDRRDSDMTAAALLLLEWFIIIIVMFSTLKLQRILFIVEQC